MFSLSVEAAVDKEISSSAHIPPFDITRETGFLTKSQSSLDQRLAEGRGDKDSMSSMQEAPACW